MRISSKGRYGLAAMLHMAVHSRSNECITIISISERLGISKIYLEQVFSLLKRAELVVSVKGAQGGYKLAAPPDQITAGAILRAVETSLFEKTESSVTEEAAAIEQTLESMVWAPLDVAACKLLDSITLEEMAAQVKAHNNGDNYMFYI